MPNIYRSALVPYTPEQMYILVDDINQYSDFLPWCGESNELSREENSVEAAVTINKGAIKKTFTTRNLLQKPEQIEMTLLDGPFKTLHGFWKFENLDGKACKVSLDLSFEFSNKIVSFAIGPIFHTVANTLVDSFVQRAKATYG